MHENIFKQLPPELQTGVVPSDVDIVDVHNRKLFVFGKILLPFKYGNHILDQEFIITSGISEECILGLDAAFTHAFVLDGRSKTVYLSRDKAVKDLLSPPRSPGPYLSVKVNYASFDHSGVYSHHYWITGRSTP